MSYESIDPVIQAWTNRHGLTLFDSAQDFPRSTVRVACISSNKGKCFLIWVTKPSLTHVTVHAENDESDTSKLFCEEWLVPSHALDNALEAVLGQVRNMMTH